MGSEGGEGGQRSRFPAQTFQSRVEKHTAGIGQTADAALRQAVKTPAAPLEAT